MHGYAPTLAQMASKFYPAAQRCLPLLQVMWAHHRVVTPAIAAFRKRYRTLHPGLWHHNRRADPRLGTVLCLAAADWAVQVRCAQEARLCWERLLG